VHDVYGRPPMQKRLQDRKFNQADTGGKIIMITDFEKAYDNMKEKRDSIYNSFIAENKEVGKFLKFIEKKNPELIDEYFEIQEEK
jgi:hypothetical protein